MASHMTNQFLNDDALAVVLVRGSGPENAPIYAYVGVRIAHLDAFMAAQTQGHFNPEDFGIVLEAGEGEPDAEVRSRMEQEYGFNHEKMVALPAQVSEAGDAPA